MEHIDSKNDRADNQPTDHQGRYSGGIFYHIPKERFTTALKISGMFRLGIEVCAECERNWDESNCNPLQDECGHVKCRSCFNHGSYHYNPCKQCVGNSGRKRLLCIKRKADDYLYENDTRDEVQNFVRNDSPKVDLEIVDVRDIMSGNITRDHVRTDTRELNELLTSERAEHSLSSRGVIKKSTAGKSRESLNSGGFIKNSNVMNAGESSTSAEFKKKSTVMEGGESLTSAEFKKSSTPGQAGENSNSGGLENNLQKRTRKKRTTAGKAGESSNSERLIRKSNIRNHGVSFSSGVPTKIFTRGDPGENSYTEVPGINANQCTQMKSPESARKCTNHDKKTTTLVKRNEAPDTPLPTRDNQEKPFTCSKCPASFSLEHHLKLHEPIHLVYNGFLFNCEICDEGFWLKVQLFRHMKKAHKMKKTEKVDCDRIKKPDLTAYIKHILNKNKSPKTSTSATHVLPLPVYVTTIIAGPTEENSSNCASSTILNPAADHLHDVEGPLVENQTRAKTTTGDADFCILKINYMLPKTETPDSPNLKTRVTVSYEDGATTSVLFHAI